MTYSGSAAAAESRALLSAALESLQQTADAPQDVMDVTQNIAAAVGALFEAERASSDVDGKSSVKHAMGSLSQTMAMLQDVAATYPGVATATQNIAQALSKLYPLASAPSLAPVAVEAARRSSNAPAAAESSPAPGARAKMEANVGATTESNFFVGFSGDIREGGVFVATYSTLPLGEAVELLLTLPGGYAKTVQGKVRFVRDPLDMESEPGIGIGFTALDQEARDLIMRFIRKRPPLFFDN